VCVCVCVYMQNIRRYTTPVYTVIALCNWRLLYSEWK